MSVGISSRLKQIRKYAGVLGAALLAAYLLAGCSSAKQTATTVVPPATTGPSIQPAARATLAPNSGKVSANTNDQQGVDYTADVTFTLETSLGTAGLSFKGKSGEIDGLSNPELKAKVGDTVQVTLLNGDGVVHDVSFPDFGATAEQVTTKGSSSTVVFEAKVEGTYAYFCTLPGHRQAGMEGKLVVGAGAAVAASTGVSIVRDPTDLPGPISRSAPADVKVELTAVEIEGNLADGSTYTYWTYDAKVPGPFLRVRAGDTVEVHMKNADTSKNIHSVDLHAVTGPGGGATVTQLAPGQENSFTFKALNPGVYVYHCATPMVANHITNGMYGLITVEPAEGLPPVDKEFYVMQGEIYTTAEFGTKGKLEFDVKKLLAEQPEYFVLNGAVGSLTTEKPLKAGTGDVVRIYYGVGGPNFTSAFHVIGEIFDRVYDQASLTTAPLTDVQTTLVPPGGATVVEFKTEVPGRYILVDHALSRLQRGLAGFLYVEGPDNLEVFDGQPPAGAGTGGH